MQSLTCLVIFLLLRGTRAGASGRAWGRMTCGRASWSGNCYDSCEGYCAEDIGCELSDTSGTTAPCNIYWTDDWIPLPECRDNWNYCGWHWQNKCHCRQCQWGGCEKQREKINDGLEKARELIDAKLENMDHGWELFFGNKLKSNRQTYVRGALDRMKQFMSNVCYTENCNCGGNSPCLAMHVAHPDDGVHNGVSSTANGWCCGPPTGPSFSSNGEQYNNNIAGATLWIAWNSEKLDGFSVNRMANVIIHELTHSSFITSTSSQHWWTQPSQAHPSARDWSYNAHTGFDDGDVENFAQCYAEAHDCGAISHLNIRDLTVQDIENHAGQWDIPMNNAENWERWFAHDECVSGDMQVETVTGLRDVRHLEVGVSIKGFNSEYEEVWCTVEAVSSNGRGVLHGDYTDKHWIVRDGVVSHNGNDAPKTIGDLYTVFTDCPAMKNADGSSFTPIADTFCGSVEFTWDEYLEVFNSISRIIAATGTFWFDTTTFKNCHGEDCRHASWQAALPEVCSAMIACSEHEEQCDDFEAVTGVFMEQHVTRSPGRRNMQAMTDTIVDAVRNPATFTSYFSSLMFWN